MSHITPSSRHVMPHGAAYIPDPHSPGWRLPNPHFTLTSKIRRGERVPFPDFTGERVYMQPFLKTDGEVLLPTRLARWIPTVAAMLAGIETPLNIGS